MVYFIDDDFLFTFLFLFLQQAEQAKVILEFRSDPEVIEVSLLIDEKRFSGALLNLMTNAIANTPAGGKIEICAFLDIITLIKTAGSSDESGRILRIQFQDYGQPFSEVRRDIRMHT
jgi:signal transduction histidine kinase